MFLALGAVPLSKDDSMFLALGAVPPSEDDAELGPFSSPTALYSAFTW